MGGDFSPSGEVFHKQELNEVHQPLNNLCLIFLTKNTTQHFDDFYL